MSCGVEFSFAHLGTALYRIARFPFGDGRTRADAERLLSSPVCAALLHSSCWQASPQNLANIFWSFARLRVKNWPLLEALAAAAGVSLTAEMSKWKPQELSSTAWSYAGL